MSSDNIDRAFRRRGRSSLEARLYHALGHGQTEAFFSSLLSSYGKPGAELARRIAAADPAGLRSCAITKVEKHPQYASAGSREQIEGYTAGQVWDLGAGLVYAVGWAAKDPAALRRYREHHGWAGGSEQ